MSKLSARGIAYDLTDTPYRTTVFYNDKEIEFRFSSRLYVEKFTDRILDNRTRIHDSLSKRFGFEIINDVLADIVLYKAIEKRDFLIVVDGEFVRCLEHITLDGNLPIVRN